MATAITTFAAADGKIFQSEVEADAHDAANANKAEIEAFVAKHFPCKEGGKKNAHGSTAAKAIALWIAAKSQAANAAE